MNKTTLLESLSKFIAQRPGLDPREYGGGLEGFAAYRSDSRKITRDKHDAQALLRYIELRDTITAQDIIDASKHAFSGRLTITPKGDGFDLDYCTGQYWPMEYRKATASVLASTVWGYLRRGMEGQGGDKIRHAARRELGAPLARRFFN
jgi:hypothetical protein